MSIADRVIAICEQQSGKEASRDSKLVDDLDLDSLDRVELAMVLEDQLRVEIPDHEVDDPKLSSVGALITLIEAKLAKVEARIVPNTHYVDLAPRAGVDLNRPGVEL